MGEQAAAGAIGGAVTSSGVRQSTAAGSFYPGRTDELASMVDGLLDGATVAGGTAAAEAAAVPQAARVPEALIVPHAGYVYSGPVAASAYALLRPVTGSIRCVAVLGPAHFVPLSGTAVPAVGAWRTPLGEVPIDEGLRGAAVRCGASVDDLPHESEHSIEVQVPFLQRVLGDGFTLLPVAVGATPPAEVAELIGALRERALVVVSTDLSHYHDDATARRLDRKTAGAVLARDPSAIGLDDACGVYALRGVVEHARRGDLRIELLDLRTSADTAGDPWRVVGYGAFSLLSGRSPSGGGGR